MDLQFRRCIHITFVLNRETKMIDPSVEVERWLRRTIREELLQRDLRFPTKNLKKSLRSHKTLYSI